MRKNDQQLGQPMRAYQDTKANIVALGLGAGDEGCTAYATDTDESGTFDGAAWAWSNHNLLGSRHSDTVANAPTRGSLVLANLIPAWSELTFPGAEAYHLQTSPSDVVWAQNITMADGAWEGIGAALERIVYNAAGYISVMGAKFGVNEPAPTEWFHITEDNTTLAGPTVVLESNHSAGTQEMGRIHFTLGATTIGAIVTKEITANEYAIAFKTWAASAGAALSTKVILYGCGTLSLEGTTGGLILHRLTTVQRNALTAVNGMIIYNTTTSKIEGYEGGAWGEV